MNKVILYPPTVEWSGVFQRPHQLLNQFAKHGWTVIYCDDSVKGTTEVRDNLYLAGNYKEAKALLGFDRPDVLYQTWPNKWRWVKETDPRLVLYDVVDEFDSWSESTKHMRPLADITIYSARGLQGDAPDNNYIPNACDSQRIIAPGEPAAVFSDLRGYQRPIVGFVGTLAPWVDVDTMRSIATSFTLFLIGPRVGPPPIPYTFSLGTIPYEELGEYYNALDVGIVPFDSSETSIKASPIKMYEYLAAGLPVVSSPLPEAVAIPEVTTAKPEDFVEAIRNVDNSPEAREARYQFSLLNTWENRYEKIQEILDER